MLQRRRGYCQHFVRSVECLVWAESSDNIVHGQKFGFNLLWPLFVGSSELANVPPVKKEKSDELKVSKQLLLFYHVVTFTSVTVV